jgi:hypothetical protein
MIRLIAIMLGRLNMDVVSCIRAYLDMSKSIFKPKGAFAIAKFFPNGKGRFDSHALEKAIKTVIVSTGRSVDELMDSGIQRKCKT